MPVSGTRVPVGQSRRSVVAVVVSLFALLRCCLLLLLLPDTPTNTPTTRS
jgi:hypothetical protein